MSKIVPRSEMTEEKQIERANLIFSPIQVTKNTLHEFIRKAFPLDKTYIIFGIKEND